MNISLSTVNMRDEGTSYSEGLNLTVTSAAQYLVLSLGQERIMIKLPHDYPESPSLVEKSVLETFTLNAKPQVTMYHGDLE